MISFIEKSLIMSDKKQDIQLSIFFLLLYVLACYLLLNHIPGAFSIFFAFPVFLVILITYGAGSIAGIVTLLLSFFLVWRLIYLSVRFFNSRHKL